MKLHHRIGSHLKKHHKKYLFGVFGSFALVKMALLFVGIFGIIQHTRTFATDMPEGVYTYDANFNVPAGYVKIVDDTTNPQYMVIMQKVPLTKQDGRQGFTYEEMKAYTPPKGYAIPTNALKDLLLTTNTSTTWVGSENFSDPGSRSDRTSDAIVDPGISNGQYYLLMSPRGYDGNYDPNGVTSNYFNATSSTKAKIRLIYVDHELNSGNITTKYGCNPGPQNLNTCAISNMDITSIAPDAFINMPNLQYLYFDNNKITSLDGIVRPASMIFLDLSRNRIAALEPGNFSGLSDLTTLYLNNNDIAGAIKKDTFSGTSKLNVLNIQDNKITDLESGAFDGLTDLHELNLGANQIASLEDGDLHGLTNLTSLALNDNQIASLQVGTFEGLPALTGLYLSNNKITALETDVFSGISQVETIDLYYNQITSLDHGDFNGLPNLVKLYVYYNAIKSIGSGAFEGLGNLIYLQLIMNQISGSLSAGTFNGLTNVQEIYLSNNQISAIESGTFNGLANIRKLSIDYNLIATLPQSIADLTSLSDRQLVLGYNCRNTGSMSADLLAFLNQKVDDSNRYTYTNGSCPVCGDGTVNGSETCDEGNEVNGTPGHCNAICNAILPPDDDEDGIANARDNCPLDANPDQENTPVTFAKANAANRALSGNQDRITDNVRFTRGATKSLFNAKTESSYTGTSPAGTERKSGNCDSGGAFMLWDTRINNAPAAKVNVPACVHLITDDRYLDIMLNYRTSTGFSYTRENIRGAACTVSEENIAIIDKYYGSGSSYTKHRTSNNCDPAAMSVKYVNNYETSGYNAIPESLSANTIYVLLSGAHVISQSQINLADCSAIIGSGDATLYSMYVIDAMIFGVEKKNVIIDNIGINGIDDGIGQTRHYPNTRGIGLYYSTDNTINGVRIYNNIYGLNFYSNSYDNTISNSQIYNNDGQGIRIQYNSNGTIIDNAQVYSNGYGIFFDASNNATINNTQVYNHNSPGIYFYNSSNNTINNSQSYNNSDGIFMINGNSHNNTLNNVQSYNNASYGIIMNNSDYNILNNTQVYNNYYGLIDEGDYNAYYGTLKVFGNTVDIGGRSTIAAGTGSDFFSGGVFDAGGTMSCDRVTNPMNASEIFLMNNPSCDSRGQQAWTPDTEIRYLYGSDILRQAPAVHDSGNGTSEYSWSDVAYDKTEHIAETDPMLNGSLTISGGKSYVIENSIQIHLATAEPSRYLLYGDFVGSPISGTLQSTATVTVSVTSGYGIKNISVTYSTGEKQRSFTKKIGYISSLDNYCELITDLPRAQCDALVDLYISTDGDHWNWNNNWLGSGDTTPETVCDNRYGISCYDDNGALYVSYMSLGENNLSGALPESIGNLTGLGNLYLYDNHITSVPETIANLTSLGEFNLSNNALASLPESFTQLSSLNYININSNAICPYALSSDLRDLLDQYNEQDDGDWRNLQDKSACDSDNDSIMDPGDNCPLVANTDQADRNKMESSETPVTFTKSNYADRTLPENQDCITPNVCITRQDDRGVFNIVREDYFDRDNNSPADTQWAMGQCSNLESLSFQPLFDIGSPYYLIGDAMCLHLISDNKYYDITFNNRTSGEGEDGGGFSYTRTEYIDNKGDVCDCSDNVCSAGNTGNDISGAPVCRPSEDACYPDTDGDGVHDNKDNCISVANPDQADTEVSEVSFTKEDRADPTDAANQDHVTDNVWLTRGDYYPLYNIKYQQFGDVSDNSTAPTDTERAFGQCDEKDSLERDYRLYGIYRNIGEPTCLHTISDNKYFDMVFDSWTSNDGGGFSYTRTSYGDGTGDACQISYPVVTQGLGNSEGAFTIAGGSSATITFNKPIANIEHIEQLISSGANGIPTYNRSEVDFTLMIHNESEDTLIWTKPIAGNLTDAQGNTSHNQVVIMTSIETDNEDPLDGSGNACTVDNTSISIDIPLHITGAKVNVDSCDVEYSGDTKIITIPQIDVTVMTDLSTSPVSVQMPPFMHITAPLDFDYNIFTPTVKENSSVTAGADQTVQSVIELGYASGSLSFDQGVRILIPGQAGKRVGYTHEGSPLTEITAICDSDSQTVGDALASNSDCKIDVGADLVIWTKHFTKFVTYSQNSGGGGDGGGGGGGGGGGIATVKKDICKVRDCSNSYYDDTCGVCPTEKGDMHGAAGDTGNSIPERGSIIGSAYSKELNTAYLYAYSVGITSMPTIQKANLEGKLLRSHMAKMMVGYAINVLGKKPDKNVKCAFTDIAGESSEMQTYIRLACAYGLMGVDTTKFKPNGEVTRAEFGTVVSRLLYGDRYNRPAPDYYGDHLSALKRNKIITNTTPTLKELRGNVMLMLWRSATNK